MMQNGRWSDEILAKSRRDGPAATCLRVAMEHTPTWVLHVRRVSDRDWGALRGEPGRLDDHPFSGNGEIAAPRPDHPDALYIFLHECGHAIHNNVCRYQLDAIRENRADYFAAEAMRRSGVTVPDWALERLRLHAAIDIKSGRKAARISEGLTAFGYHCIFGPASNREAARSRLEVVVSNLQAATGRRASIYEQVIGDVVEFGVDEEIFARIYWNPEFKVLTPDFYEPFIHLSSPPGRIAKRLPFPYGLEPWPVVHRDFEEWCNF